MADAQIEVECYCGTRCVLPRDERCPCCLAELPRIELERSEIHTEAPRVTVHMDESGGLVFTPLPGTVIGLPADADDPVGNILRLMEDAPTMAEMVRDGAKFVWTPEANVYRTTETIGDGDLFGQEET